MFTCCDSPTGLLSLVGSSRVPTAHQLFLRCLLQWKNPALFCVYHWYFQSHFYEGLFICHCNYLFDQVFDHLITTLQPSLTSLEVQAATMYTTFFPQRSVAVCVRTAVCVGVDPNKSLALSPNLCFNAYFASHSHKKVKLKWNHAGMAPQFLWPWLLKIRTRRLMKCVS